MLMMYLELQVLQLEQQVETKDFCILSWLFLSTFFNSLIHWLQLDWPGMYHHNLIYTTAKQPVNVSYVEHSRLMLSP